MSAAEVRVLTLVFVETKSAPKNDKNMISNYKINGIKYITIKICSKVHDKALRTFWDMLSLRTNSRLESSVRLFLIYISQCINQVN